MTSIIDIYVKIEWNKPYENHQPIQGYKVLLKSQLGSYELYPSHCDGTTVEAIDNLFCTVEMNTFWGEPFNYQLDDLIQAKVIAFNERGDSLISDANFDGALTQTVPAQMQSVTRGAETSAF